MKNICDQKFGKLTAKFRSGTKLDKNGYSVGAIWYCECECGGSKDVFLPRLTSGRTVSCGCSHKEFLQSDRCKELLSAGRKTKNSMPSWINRLYDQYKRSAEKRGLCFELSWEDVFSMTSMNCWFCGAQPAHKSTGGRHNGIDRFDNSIGYTMQNSFPCCSTCNYMKNTMNGREFLDAVERIYKCRIQR